MSAKITPLKMNNFVKRYGLILNLWNTRVDTRALVVLAQYYDPPLCCFTFKDFQLTPTIEEFERLLGWYVKDHPPFIGLGDQILPGNVAKALHIPVSEVADLLKPRGILIQVLEERACKKEGEKNWEAFNAMLALLIYGTIMFPNKKDYIDLPAVNVFLSNNPVPALLGDVYYYLLTRHEKKRGMILYCAPFLYLWLKSHIPQTGSWELASRDLKWSQKLASLSTDDVVWYLPTWDVEKVITSCGEFPNVPIIDSVVPQF